MSKLTFEWTDPERNIITVRKARGKITMQELVEFMHEREQIWSFDGKLAIFMFRVNGEADLHPYGWNEPQGDAQDLLMLEDGMRCPICSQEMFIQYCPDCGRKLFGGTEVDA